MIYFQRNIITALIRGPRDNGVDDSRNDREEDDGPRVCDQGGRRRRKNGKVRAPEKRRLNAGKAPSYRRFYRRFRVLPAAEGGKVAR